jgi:hydrogenase-1 operon protein HyaF
MRRLTDIPVQIHAAERADPGLSGNAPFILAEAAAALARLVRDGSGCAIDLRALPLTPADRAWLRGALGTGEVRASIDAAGESTVEETAFPGVWWVTHHSEAGEAVAELIEITLVPEILKTHPADAEAGMARLEAIAAGASLDNTKGNS